MKKYFAIFLLPLMVACVKGPQESTISGTLKNYKDSVAYITSKGITETVKLDADKKFTFKTTIDKPLLYSLRTGRRTSVEFYVNPGDATEFVIDYENVKDGAKFTGKLEAVNNFLAEKDKVTNKYFGNMKAVFSLDKDAFKLKLDSLSNDINEKIKSISVGDIAELEKASLGYISKGLLVNYPQYNAYFNSIEFNADSADYSVLEGLDLNNAGHLIFTDYAELLNKYFEVKLTKEIGLKAIDSIPTSEKLTKLFSIIDVQVTNAEVRDYLKQNALVADLSYGEFWKLNDLVNKFLTECQTLGYKKIVEDLYKEKQSIAPGKPAPLFRYKDINGKEYALEDLKGKLVYIDFWATWCGPCLHELPYLEEVQKAYEGKKVTFISMSMDDNMDAWRKMVKEKKMKGLQLHADGAFKSTVAKDYQIKFIPTLYLIDENGIIITSAAPRPSSDTEKINPELINILDANLAKIK